MTAGAGQPIPSRELEREAEELLAAVEVGLQRVAGEIRPGTPWRTLYGELQEDRWPEVEGTLAAYRAEIERAERFLRERRLLPLPPIRPEVRAARNPVVVGAFPLALYVEGRLGVVIPPEGGGVGNHCRACIPPLVVHETYPGHHVAFALTGRSRMSADPVEPFFHEGWAFYGELLMLEQGYYARPEERLAAWRNVYLRVLRAWIDPRLHRGELTPEAASRIYRERALLPKESAATELRGHLRKPGVKASYLVGCLQLLELRRQLLTSSSPPSLFELHAKLLGRVASWPTIARDAFGLEIGPLDEAVTAFSEMAKKGAQAGS